MPVPESRIAIVGRLGRITPRRLSYVLARRQTVATRHLSQRTALAVITHGAIGLFQSGRLGLVIARADRWSIPVISENAFLREIGVIPPLEPEPRPFTIEEFVIKTGLTRGSLRLLNLFDIIEPEAERYSFRDLKAGRDFARLVTARRDLPSAIAKALAVREAVAFQRHLAELVLAPDNEVRIGALDLGDEPESFDTLWNAALAAQFDADYAEAAEAYRRCTAMRPRDTDCLFNLASVLSRLGQEEEARGLLQRAITLKPRFPEALFELAALSQGEERVRLLERTVADNPDHLAAVHDLATAYTNADQYARALPLWERFLSLASAPSAPPLDSATREHAKKALLLCRMVRLRNQASGSKET